MCSLIDCLEKISAPMVRFYIDYSKEAEDDFLGGLSPFIIDLDEKVSVAIIYIKYIFSVTEETLIKLKKSYD